MHAYEFAVSDSNEGGDRFWGDVRTEADSQEEAEAACVEYLVQEDADGTTSLDFPICLELIAVDAVGCNPYPPE